MVKITIKMTAISSKLPELLRALHELRPIISREKGCRRASFAKQEKDANRITIYEEWKTSENALAHFRSDSFHVLVGAIRVLTRSSELSVAIGSRTARMGIGLTTSSRDIYNWMGNVLYDISQGSVGDFQWLVGVV